MSTMVEDLDSLLQVRGADDHEHAGGTLFVHLHRVANRLRRLDAPEHVVHAGLAHAAYGTDGFTATLFDWETERSVLASVIGEEAERLVYRYGACDRAASWPTLAERHAVRDRFTGATQELVGDELRDFADLCVVNELDVLDHAPELEPRLRAYLGGLVSQWKDILSPAVYEEARRTVAP